MFRLVQFVGRSREDLREFPAEIRDRVGRQLLFVQEGGLPDDWKPMKSIGPGASEIRVRDASGAYRVIFVAKFEEAIYVLHCFEKKSQKTSRTDLDTARARNRALLARRLGHPRSV